jgi:pimeloyl-ACP methyl ester carboxylesterase
MRLLRPVLATLAGVALLLGLTAGAAPTPPDPATTAAAQVAAAGVPHLDWTDCGGGFQCATATVPRDYDRPHGPTFRLPVIKWPAKDQAHKVGSMFMNPGGPGGSGVGFLRGAPAFALDLFSRFDVVSWDPRGIGSSVPAMDCTTREEDNATVNVHFTPLSEVDREVAVRTARTFVANCVARNPDVLPYLGTGNTARDLDLLRAAVGDEKLTYIGISYGGAIGATYAKLFPGRARAVLLDSPVDPDVWTNRPFEMRREQNASFEDSLDRFFSACAAHQDGCGFGGDNPQDAFDALVERMNATPVPAPNATFPDPVRGDDVNFVATQAMYSVYDWQTFALALAQAQAGDASLMRELFDYNLGRAADGSYNDTNAYFGVSGQDFRISHDVDDYYADAISQHAMFPHQWPYALGQNLRYAVYRLPQNDVVRGPFSNPRSAAPILVIGGKHDPAAPYDWSRRMVAAMGNARLLTFDAEGHGAVTQFNPCVTAAMLAYINDVTLPAPGTVCTQGVAPFPTGTAARSKAAAVPAARWEAPRTR